MNIKIAVIEDDDELRKLFSEMLHFYTDLNLVGSFESAEKFKEAMPVPPPDVALMDIGLPKQSGIDCIRELKPLFPTIQFVMLTVSHEPNRIFEALAAGASGYLLKPSTPDKIAEAVRDVAAGGSPMSGAIARLVVETFQRTEQKFPELDKLSLQERKVLEQLRDGLAYKEVGSELFISISTVRSHVRSIYEKLEVHCRTEALNKVFGRT